MTSSPHFPPILPAFAALVPLHQPTCGSLDMVPTLWPLPLLPASLLPGIRNPPPYPLGRQLKPHPLQETCVLWLPIHPF